MFRCREFGTGKCLDLNRGPNAGNGDYVNECERKFILLMLVRAAPIAVVRSNRCQDDSDEHECRGGQPGANA